MKNLKILVIIIYFLSAGIVFAVNTQLWEVKEFTKCKLTNVMLDENGNALVAPGLKELWKNPELYIWSILEVGDMVYIGTGGKGKVYRMSGSGGYIDSVAAKVIFDSKEAGIFALAERGGKIYAGTSPDGIIYVIDKSGVAKVFADTKQKYIWKMFFGDDGFLYAATGTSGKVLKITQSGEIDTFYVTSEMNVTSLDYFKGSFYVGTGENGYLFKVNRSGKGICIFDASEKEIKSVIFSDTFLLVAATNDSSGAVYRIYSDNKVEKLWSTSFPIRGFRLLGGDVIVAAGKRLYKIKPGGSYVLISELPAGVSCMKGKFVCTSEVGKLYRVSDVPASEGLIESDAYDTDVISQWGTLEYEAVGSPEFFTRSGNISNPDNTWSEWAPITGEGKIASPNLRFVQWKAVLRGGASLQRVRLAYLPQNQKPEVLSIWLTRKSDKESSRKITWSAKDGNNDSLVFEVYFKLTNEKAWSLLKEDLRDSSYSIDQQTFPDGKYEFKVICSDILSNPEVKALKNEKVSLPELIDNTAPEVKNINTEGGKITFSAEDEFNYIKSCEYAVDGGVWNMLFPKDGLFDSKEEVFSISVKNAKKVAIRVSDYFNNTVLKSKVIK